MEQRGTTPQGLFDFMAKVYRLKDLHRAGWVQRGIHNPESVGDHSFGSAVLAMTLAHQAGVDQNKSVKMALTHELAESVIGDLTPLDGVSREEKIRREEAVMRDLCATINGGNEIISLFIEYNQAKTPEAIFVRIVNKLDMMYQAYIYESSDSNIDLHEFWDGVKQFDWGKMHEIYEALEDKHLALKKASTH